MNERKQHIPVPEFDNKDTQGVLAALYRAARRAHRVAHQHGTGVVVLGEGKVVPTDPEPETHREDVKRQ